MTKLLHISGLTHISHLDLVSLGLHLRASGLEKLDGLVITGLTNTGNEADLRLASWLVSQCKILFDLSADQITLVPSAEDVNKGFGYFDDQAHVKALGRKFKYSSPHIVEFGEVQLISLNTIVAIGQWGLSKSFFETTLHQAINQASSSDLKRIFAFYHPMLWWNFGDDLRSTLNVLAQNGELHLTLSGVNDIYFTHNYLGLSSPPGQVLHITMSDKALIAHRFKLIHGKKENHWHTIKTLNFELTSTRVLQCG